MKVIIAQNFFLIIKTVCIPGELFRRVSIKKKSDEKFHNKYEKVWKGKC